MFNNLYIVMKVRNIYVKIKYLNNDIFKIKHREVPFIYCQVYFLNYIYYGGITVQLLQQNIFVSDENRLQTQKKKWEAGKNLKKEKKILKKYQKVKK